MAAGTKDVDAELVRIAAMGVDDLRDLWRTRRGSDPPPALTKDLIARALAWWVQVDAFGEPAQVRKILASVRTGRAVAARRVKPGSVIMREYAGVVHEVTVLPEGYLWRGRILSSLSAVAFEITGTKWNGPKFFGVGERKRSVGESLPSRLQSADCDGPTAGLGEGGPL